ncbi:MAG TPA: FtsQ-type POTRA domain-containing protein [Thermoleophilaceae bacterium]|nr:FtsQ-type POTRA domain-containing protein [Thermoleophilaceae bacterium]
MSALAAGVRRTLPALVVALPPRLRRRLIVAAVAGLLLGGLYLLWFRDSSFVRVERVVVAGLSTKDAKTLRRALVAAGSSMTTLHVDQERLEQVVAGYPVVRDVRVSPDFPHALRIEVIEHRPAAIAVTGGSRVPVAGDGTILRGLPVQGKLPEVQVRGSLPPERLRDPRALRFARIAGGAPAALSSRLASVREEKQRGLVVEMRDGPLLIFGALTRVRDKWAAAARVLADPEAQGATYVDVRLPERPAAGGVAAETLAPLPAADSGAVPPVTGAAPEDPAAAGAPLATDPATAPAAPAPPASGGPGTTTGTPQAAPPPATEQPAAAAPQPQQGTGGGALANPQP